MLMATMQIQALADPTLVPIQLAGYILVLYAVVDRASVRTRSRVAAAQPLLYQCLYLFLRELVPNFTAEWHAMVTRILFSLLIPSAVPLIAEIASLKPPAISPRSARVEITRSS